MFVSEKTRSSVLSCPLTTVFIFLYFDPCVSQNPCWEEKGQFIQDLWVAGHWRMRKDIWRKACRQDTDVTECGLEVCACRCSGSDKPQDIRAAESSGLWRWNIKKSIWRKSPNLSRWQARQEFLTGEKCKREVFQGNESLPWTQVLFPSNIPIDSLKASWEYWAFWEESRLGKLLTLEPALLCAQERRLMLDRGAGSLRSSTASSLHSFCIFFLGCQNFCLQQSSFP